MRSEKEMYDLVVTVAQQDDRIRAVAMNGSRTNPNAPVDIFQDYDIVYLVTDMQSFIQDPNWTSVFGETIIMQTPEDMSLFPPDLGGWFSYLMLFKDGNRIDLILIPIEEKDKYVKDDKLIRILLDKDHSLPDLPAPTDEDYWVKPPTAAHFADCCNEFWWVSTYVAKGLWRKELLFALDHLHSYMRPMLMRMLEWNVGSQTNFSINVGKSGKYLEKYVTAEFWQELLSTYPSGSYEDAWRALFAMTRLFRKVALEVASQLQYEYPHQDDENVTFYLQHVHQLPSDATEIFK
ncbi:aminoglycoside 6-adenylyltransferase [Bacillus horti]|uniref:Aminoglycoside 6-adenylyltransferase n=1 Tax=Caldalkalibacillus horti TaxID=77523 RepID=A0ABT9VV63_9BACI|nr:aminoglycoside 6-adenylyltransferase [Bacillus horti]MDQ0164717.1 aminoglycoside 6-adenylyltransferase [Bacillus horti]